jgi:prevent-host-death family protein
MSTHSVVEAKNQLSALIEKALRGERVVITRHGQPVVELNPVREAKPRPSGKEAVEWLRQNRPKVSLGDIDAGQLVSRMRDEDWR